MPLHTHRRNQHLLNDIKSTLGELYKAAKPYIGSGIYHLGELAKKVGFHEKPVEEFVDRGLKYLRFHNLGKQEYEKAYDLVADNINPTFGYAPAHSYMVERKESDHPTPAHIQARNFLSQAHGIGWTPGAYEPTTNRKEVRLPGVVQTGAHRKLTGAQSYHGSPRQTTATVIEHILGALKPVSHGMSGGMSEEDLMKLDKLHRENMKEKRETEEHSHKKKKQSPEERKQKQKEARDASDIMKKYKKDQEKEKRKIAQVI